MTESELNKIINALKESQIKVQDNGNRSADKTFSALMREVKEELKDMNQKNSYFQERISSTMDSIHSRLCIVEGWIDNRKIEISVEKGFREGQKNAGSIGWKAITTISTVAVVLIGIAIDIIKK